MRHKPKAPTELCKTRLDQETDSFETEIAFVVVSSRTKQHLAGRDEGETGTGLPLGVLLAPAAF